MKILYFGGGLGNQIFEFAFYSYLKKHFPSEHIYSFFRKGCFSEHYGLELTKWFEAEFPQEKWYAKVIVLIIYLLKKIGTERFLDRSTTAWSNKKAVVIHPLKYSRTFVPKESDWLKWKIKDDDLSDQNMQILNKIRSSHSCFIHVRKGDYLSPKYKSRFEGTCPLSYYDKAIAKVKETYGSVSFFVFSDDIEWARKNLPVEKASFINWNIGDKSPLDMYLMSQCESAIIANSTFGFWGACLGKKKKLCIYPTKWFNGEPAPDIFSNEWMTY